MDGSLDLEDICHEDGLHPAQGGVEGADQT